MKHTFLLFGLLTFLTFKSQAQATVTDATGHVYNTVTIGTQTWIQENLRTTKYSDGSDITNVTNPTTWSTLSSGAYCDYDNTLSYSMEYGKLYNWFAINTATNGGKHLCPTGWHVPSDTELITLTTFLGGDAVAGGYLKEMGYTHWINPNVGATNSSGFTARAGGYRNQNGSFQDISSRGYLGSATAYTSTTSWYLKLFSDYSSVLMDYGLKGEGFSIRCIKDDGITNINENQDNIKMHIFPNPAIDRFSIDCFERQNVKMQVYNTIGARVLQSELTSGSNDIDISSLSKGIYVIRLTGENWTEVQKLTKE